MHRGAILLLALSVIAGSATGRGRGDKGYRSERALADTVRYEAHLPYWQRRETAVYDVGRFTLPVSEGTFSQAATHFDPETGQTVLASAFYEPGEGQDLILYGGGIWVGGIVNNDTVVSVGFDGWFLYPELFADKPDSGGIFRKGDFADDEFVSVFQDTVPSSGPYDPPFPVNIRVTETGYSWADTAYGDFVILTYTIENIGDDSFNDGWVGFYIDPDLMDPEFGMDGYTDDICGILDTVLYADDPQSRVMIPYAIDVDGDPINGMWDSLSCRSSLSIRLIDADFPVKRKNFNWWYTNTASWLDWGPRQLGSDGEPVRQFANHNYGTPVSDGDKYYFMSYPEVDYNGFEILLHGPTDGWLSPPEFDRASDMANGFDTRFVYSFGSFDLAPGEKTSFTIALVAAARVHTVPTGFRDLWDPLNPFPYMATFDFSDLICNHRRVDSVYNSGFTLPRPGPPPGLHVVDFNQDSVTVAWPHSKREGISGYYVSVRDSLLDNVWRHVSKLPTIDTQITFPVLYADHRIFAAVSLIDAGGRESRLSQALSLIPAAPKAPVDFSVTLESITPRLEWRPGDESMLEGYLIYRSEDEEPFILYDSTAARGYYDYGAESGAFYSYKVSTKNDYGLESKATEAQSVLPMSLSEGILFYNMNPDGGGGSGPYQRQYLDSLFAAITATEPMQRVNSSDSAIGLKVLSKYSIVVMDMEMRLGKITPEWIKATRLYLENGGKALIILLTASPQWVLSGSPRSYVFRPGDFFYDVLKLDSCVTNNYQFSAGSFTGDLIGCKPLNRMYPQLVADFDKLASSLLTIHGGIPMAGYLFPQKAAEPLYTYQSNNPDTVSHGQINAIRYRTEEGGSFALFSIPLTLMQSPGNERALRQALLQLGVETRCGDVNDDGYVSPADAAYLINALYRDGTDPPVMQQADVNCDGKLDLTDVVQLLDFVYDAVTLSGCCQ